MASTVYDVEEIELQDGTVVTVRPLDIKRLRKFMKVMDAMNDRVQEQLDKMKEASSKGEEVPEDENEDGNLPFLLDMVAISIEKTAPDLAKNRDKLEEAVDMPTIWHIMEIAGGIKQNPNLQTGAESLGTI